MRSHRVLLALILVGLLPASTVTGHTPTQAQTSGWHLVGPLPVPVTGLAAATGLDGRVYAFGGALESGQPINNAEVYYPDANAWTAIPPLPVANGYMSATLAYNGKIYLVGGWDGQESIGLVEAYDPSTNTWSCSVTAPGCAATNLASLPTPRANLGVTWGPEGTIWAIGGFTSVPVATVEIYDIRANRWSTGPQFPYSAAGVSAGTGPDGTIYGFGGHDAQETYYGQLYAFHPGPSPRMAAARWQTSQTSESSHQTAGSTFQPIPIPGSPGYIEYLMARQKAEEKLAETEKAVALMMIARFRTFSEGWDAGPIQPYAPSLRASLRANQQQTTHVAALISQDPPSTGPPASNAVDLWDVTGSAIFSLPPMVEPRTNGAMVLGGNGTFYVMGGDDGNGTLYRSVEAYTPPMPPPTETPTNTVAPTNTPQPTATNTPLPPPSSTPPPPPTATPVPTVKTRALSCPKHSSKKKGKCLCKKGYVKKKGKCVKKK